MVLKMGDRQNHTKMVRLKRGDRKSKGNNYPMKTRSDIAKAQEKLGQNAQVILTVNLWNNSRSGIEKKVDGNRKTFDDATKSRKSKMHFQQTSNPVGLNVTGAIYNGVE